MLGAISGDIIGSRFEWNNQKIKDFELFHPNCKFTDDTVLTVAVADCLLNNKDYAAAIRSYGIRYPEAGYGGTFKKWLAGEITGPYNSWGNGSAMRVSPVAYFGNTIELVLEEAKRSAEVTHNHPEGIKGAQAVAAAIYLAKNGSSKEAIKAYIESNFGYRFNQTVVEIRYHYEFDVSCQGSVPEAITAFLESVDFEDCIRTAISIGGDSDTIACMAGSIAEAFYGGVPANIKQEVIKRLPKEFLDILNLFYAQIE